MNHETVAVTHKSRKRAPEQPPSQIIDHIKQELKAAPSKIKALKQAFLDYEPPSEIIIERDTFYHRWCMYFSEKGKCACLDEHGREFPDYIDPMVVSKSIHARANGPIKVWWNL